MHQFGVVPEIKNPFHAMKKNRVYLPLFLTCPSNSRPQGPGFECICVFKLVSCKPEASTPQSQLPGVLGGSEAPKA